MTGILVQSSFAFSYRQELYIDCSRHDTFQVTKEKIQWLDREANLQGPFRSNKGKVFTYYKLNEEGRRLVAQTLSGSKVNIF